MESYIELQLKPDNEMPLNDLMNRVYSKLHKALYDLTSHNIGVSFPSYRITLGNIIRLHSTNYELEKLQNKNWLGGMQSYCDISDILAVPIKTKFRVISRVQSNMTQSKLKRLMNRSSISEVDVKQYRAKMFTKSLDNPYVEITSCSNGNRYRRFIHFSELIDSPLSGDFDHFGLSKSASIPWF
jgi:CRISPR-associated endonuclease Csy4